MKRLFLLLAVGLWVAAIGLPTAAQADTAPANDSFAGATVITSVPYSTTEDTSQATWDSTDPSGCSSNGSVWFSFTPSSDMTLKADASGSSYTTGVSAWTGTQGSLNLVSCGESWDGSKVTFSANAGTTYYFMVGQCCGAGSAGGGSLHFSVSQVLPPGNDNFSNATSIGGLPFADTQDLTVATTESGEPVPACYGANYGSVWYSFTPQTTQSVTATVDQYGAQITAYTGSSLSSLSEVGCTYGAYYGPLTFRAQAGTTYYFQVANWYGSGLGAVTFHLDVAPNPIAQFSYNPGDPSSFDTTHFYDYSYDPGGLRFSSWAWDFGDGATSTDQNPTHRYAADGDYTVSLTATTSDGRTDSTSQVVQVRTHDVAVTRLAVPKSAHVGQTIAINVYVQNTRYPETVEVDLAKSVPGGFLTTGSLTESVPVKLAGQTTRFAFTYTVTSDDKALGKMTFRAYATIVNHRDALPGDNELLSTPVAIS
jgi:PKD repeat protein